MSKKILIIAQRSNGDVFLASPLITALHKHYKNPIIDLLINDDTLAITKTLPFVNKIIEFSYQKKSENRFGQEKNIIKQIYKKYDVSINLTASDRSVLYAMFASSFAISAIEKNSKKSWWKKLLLKKYYYFDDNIAIIKNNVKSLELLGIDSQKITIQANYTTSAKNNISKKLNDLDIGTFIIFHPSAQYEYKIYPQKLRNELLNLLNTLGVAIIITGSKNTIDLHIKQQLPKLTNIYDFIGETSLDEFIALSELSCGYIGMDTLNMHIASSQNKQIFAIFGPTILSTWSPWCADLQTNTSINKPLQKYGNITLFQADMNCVACGKAGCDDRHGNSECLDNIAPRTIFDEVSKIYNSEARLRS